MLDAAIRRLIDPPLNRAGRALASMGASANTITLMGLALGLAAAAAIALGHPLIGLTFVLASRLADGLDGAVARARGITDFGGYLDIVSDFIFYGAIPLAFVIADPQANGLAGGVLLASFYATGTTFLAFAVMAEKRGLTSDAQGVKSLFYLSGLAEGTETIAVFVAMCLFPGSFAAIAWVFAAVCFATAGLRIINVSVILR